MSHKGERVVLTAWVDPVLRDYVREAARLSGLGFSQWVERAVQQAVARDYTRAIRGAIETIEAKETKP